ncbi:hypothetical protein Ct9H90mP29_14180 [bacterium]|nr:MAG: hypothetical protein Ct9H90mP29_14180 [bacterium]
MYEIFGKHVVPGFLLDTLGLVSLRFSCKATNDHSETGDINPNVRANVAYNPDSDLIPVTRSNGVW